MKMSILEDMLLNPIIIMKMGYLKIVRDLQKKGMLAWSDGEHCLAKLYFQEILHKEIVNTIGTAIVMLVMSHTLNSLI